MRLTGTLLDIEHADGTFRDRETGQDVPWSNATLHILDGREVVKVKVKGSDVEALPPFEVGKPIDLRVSVTANAGARGPYLTVGYSGVYSAGLDAPKAVKPLAVASGGN